MSPELELPEIPAFVLVVVNLFAPYIIALVNQPSWSPNAKRLISVAGSLILSVVALGIYYAASGEPIPAWWVLLLLGVLVSQATYSLIAKPLGAKVLEEATSPRGAS